MTGASQPVINQKSIVSQEKLILLLREDWSLLERCGKWLQEERVGKRSHWGLAGAVLDQVSRKLVIIEREIEGAAAVQKFQLSRED